MTTPNEPNDRPGLKRVHEMCVSIACMALALLVVTQQEGLVSSSQGPNPVRGWVWLIFIMMSIASVVTRVAWKRSQGVGAGARQYASIPDQTERAAWLKDPKVGECIAPLEKLGYRIKIWSTTVGLTHTDRGTTYAYSLQDLQRTVQDIVAKHGASDLVADLPGTKEAELLPTAAPASATVLVRPAAPPPLLAAVTPTVMPANRAVWLKHPKIMEFLAPLERLGYQIAVTSTTIAISYPGRGTTYAYSLEGLQAITASLEAKYGPSGTSVDT